MGHVIRYFSPTGAGNQSGTSVGDSAPLIDGSGNWSTVITGHDFRDDSLEARIVVGKYYPTTSFANNLFTNPPTANAVLTMHGAALTGERLEPPDPNWVSAMPPWDVSGLPEIQFDAYNHNVSVTNLCLRLLRLSFGNMTVTGVNGSLCLDWVHISCRSVGAASYLATSAKINTNVVIITPKTSDRGIDCGFNVGRAINCRVEGVAGADTGPRVGIALRSTGGVFGCTIVNQLVGIRVDGAANVYTVDNSIIHDCASTGINMVSNFTTGILSVSRSHISSCGGYGINANGSPGLVISGNRLRNNTSGNITPIPGNPLVADNLVIAGDDSEFVDALNGDFRISATSPIWGKGYGVADEIPTPEQIAEAVWGRVGRDLT